jgi:hypothetical protein
MMKLLLVRLITKRDNGSPVNIICDNHTTKVGSTNSLTEYIKIEFLLERNFNINLNIQLVDSDDKNAYPVQAADYVANALYGSYEFNDSTYSSKLEGVVHRKVEFPYKQFGK